MSGTLIIKGTLLLPMFPAYLVSPYILDLELFVEKFIEPKIDLKTRTGRIWTFSRTKLVSECQ